MNLGLENRIAVSSRSLDKSKSYNQHSKIGKTYFSLFDPPKALILISALIPDITTQESRTSSTIARSSASHNPGASKTYTSPALAPTLALHVTTLQPTQTRTLTPHPTQEANELQPKRSSSDT